MRTSRRTASPSYSITPARQPDASSSLSGVHPRLQAVVQHVAIGLLGYRKDGEIILSNAAAGRLLRIPSLERLGDIRVFSDELVEALENIAPRKRALIKVTKEGQDLFLSLYATDMVMRGQDIRLVSIQNIQRELEEKEMEAWHNLIRVLTHEIMNSDRLARLHGQRQS